MPRWAAVSLIGLAALGVAAIIVQGVVIFTLISRQHHTQMQVCFLYSLQHPLRVMPPGCHR